MDTHYNRIAGGDVGRIEALSDGIFAFDRVGARLSNA